MGLFTFLKVLIHHPREIGAILPSSKYLAEAMAHSVASNEAGLIVELGAGTGVITKALLNLISPNQILAIESDPLLAKQLQKDLPDIEILQGNATHLNELLEEKSSLVHTIVSSLPLRSLPKKDREQILLEISKVLKRGGQYIQFTYDIRSKTNYYPPEYKKVRSFIIWKNIPPAKIDVFHIQK